MLARRSLTLTLIALFAGSAWCEEAELPVQRRPAVLAISTTSGIVETPLSTLVTDSGPLVSLATVVARLGGELTASGPLDQGFELVLLDQTMVFGEGSTVVTQDQEIRAISQAPVILGGNPYVPVDLLTRTYGEAMGFVFRWDRREGRLEVARRPPRDLGVSVDLVHLQGVSTVVVQFAQRPRYRVTTSPERVDVEIVGDRLLGRPVRSPAEDPYVDGIYIARDRIVLRLAPGTAADHYTLESPFRLVFDVHRDRSASQPPIGPPPVVPTPDEISVGGKDASDEWTIVLDPGHGGSETGAIGPAGTAEKDLTLILALGLKARLEARLPVRVVLTREEDAELPLETRTALANQHRAHLFVSLHLNASLGNRAHGAETYFLSLTASDEEAARTAELENLGQDESLGGNVEDLDLILWDLAQSYHMVESQRLANLIQRELNAALGMRDRGVRQAPFKVLMGATMPAVLVELGFVSNPEEESRLHDPRHRDALVDALTRAITRFRSLGGEGLAIDEGYPR